MGQKFVSPAGRAIRTLTHLQELDVRLATVKGGFRPKSEIESGHFAKSKKVDQRRGDGGRFLDYGRVLLGEPVHLMDGDTHLTDPRRLLPGMAG